MKYQVIRGVPTVTLSEKEKRLDFFMESNGELFESLRQIKKEGRIHGMDVTEVTAYPNWAFKYPRLRKDIRELKLKKLLGIKINFHD